MVRVNDKELDKTVVYEYDSYGNILSKKECSYTEADVNSIVGTTVSYTYDENWKDELTSYNGQSITYDSIGNPKIYMGAEIEWFARQMQSYITDTLKITYKYDTDGLRTQKVVNGVEHNYYYVDGLLRIEEIKGSYTLNYRYDDRGVLIAVSSYNVNTGAVNILYAMTNTRGDVVALYDGDGDIRTRYTYDAWGKLVSVTDGDGNALGANKLGSLNSIRYRGYVYDTETGLYYLQSRYYDPEVGRFLNADSVDFIGYSGEVLSYNMFAYCENNAVNYVDASGYNMLYALFNYIPSLGNAVQILMYMMQRLNDIDSELAEKIAEFEYISFHKTSESYGVEKYSYTFSERLSAFSEKYSITVDFGTKENWIKYCDSTITEYNNMIYANIIKYVFLTVISVRWLYVGLYLTTADFLFSQSGILEVEYLFANSSKGVLDTNDALYFIAIRGIVQQKDGYGKESTIVYEGDEHVWPVTIAL